MHQRSSFERCLELHFYFQPFIRSAGNYDSIKKILITNLFYFICINSRGGNGSIDDCTNKVFLFDALYLFYFYNKIVQTFFYLILDQITKVYVVLNTFFALMVRRRKSRYLALYSSFELEMQIKTLTPKFLCLFWLTRAILVFLMSLNG